MKRKDLLGLDGSEPRGVTSSRYGADDAAGCSSNNKKTGSICRENPS